jgi:hypothetical protein
MEATQEERSFNPSAYLIKLRGGEYLPVKWRIYWFRQVHPQGTIETKLVEFSRERQFALFCAQVSDGQGGVATGYGSESAVDFADYIEKAETKAIGRALAALGFGTQFALEFDEGNRIVDAPVERLSSAPYQAHLSAAKEGNSSVADRRESYAAAAIQVPSGADATEPALAEQGEDAEPATEQQVRSIRKLCAALGRAEPEIDGLTDEQARTLITQLSREYNRLRRAS